MPEEESNVRRSIRGTSDTFVVNIKSLRVLNEQIGKHADEHDEALAMEKYERMTELFPALKRLGEDRTSHNKETAIERYDSAPEGDGAEDGYREGDAEDETSEEALLDEVVEEMKASLRDANVRAGLEQLRPLLSRKQPEQGLLLRRGALTTLISVFEGLVSDLVQSYYLKYPAALPSEDQVLTFSDLEDLGSIEDARQHLVHRKTDSILREALEKQLEFFRKALKIDLSLLDEDFPRLVEVSQRRNLIVHNNGVVNRHYLARVSPELVEFYGAEEGEPLATTEKYLSEAIDLVSLAGLLLSQQCWRKWEKGSAEKADGMLVDETYESLKEGRFALTVRVARFCQVFDIRSENRARRVIVNHAIALKELGQLNDMELLLSETDWSACSLPFQLALHALRDEDTALYQMLPKAVAVGEVERWHLEEWPLFASQRKTERFEEALERNFPGESKNS